jgi:superfamily II DNA/RNA helicase
MTLEAALATASAKPAGKRPYFLNPEVERARVDTLERLLERKGIMTRSEIETFEPSPDEAEQRGLWTQEYIARVLRIVQQEAEQLKAGAGAELASEDVAREVSGDDPP